MATREEIADAIAGMALFADLARPQLLGVASRFEEAFFPKDARVLRQGLTGSGFFVILDGEADVIADGQKRATLARGDFFGEVSVLLGEAPIADVVAVRPLRCIVLSGPDVEAFLIDHPRVMYRMLQVQSRRLRTANERSTSAVRSDA
jgi:CRP-like cAMP-binding protein